MSEVVKSSDSNESKRPVQKFTDISSYNSYASGMYQVISAMLASIDSIQNYDSEGLMPLSQAILTQSETYANAYIEEMSGTNNPNSDLSRLNNDIAGKDHNGNPISGSDQTNLISADVQTYNFHNTVYNQSNTYFSGLTNGLNQSSSDTTQTISIDLQMYQDGPLSQMQTLTQVI